MNQKLVQHLRRRAFDFFGVRWSVDTKKSIFLFTHGRGGGTWFQESLAERLKMPMIFEPLTGTSFNQLAQENFNALHTPTTDDKEFLRSYFDEVITGKKLKGQHVFQNQFFLRKQEPAVLKFVNRTELIPFLYKEYKTEIPFVYLFRNPISILRSRKSYGKEMLDERPLTIDSSEIKKYFTYLPSKDSPWELVRTNYELDVFKVYAHRYLVKKKLYDIPIAYLDYDELKSKSENPSKDLMSKLFDFSELSKSKSSSSRKIGQKQENRELPDDLLDRLNRIETSMNQLIK